MLTYREIGEVKNVSLFDFREITKEEAYGKVESLFNALRSALPTFHGGGTVQIVIRKCGNSLRAI